MTCIVAVRDGGKVHMGCDSIGTDGWRKEARTRPKIIRKGPMMIGYCGSFRIADIVEHHVTAPKLLPDEDVRTWLVKEVVPVLRTELRNGGSLEKKDETDRIAGCLIIAIRGHLFEIDVDLQVGETTRGYAAAGSGEPFAMGSLFSTNGQPIADRLRIALEAAHEMCATVAPPFHYLSEE